MGISNRFFFLDKIKKLNGDPHDVALGLAIGVFVAMTPTIPFHTILAVVLAFFLKASKPAAILGTWVSNPVTLVFLYLASFKVGHFLFPNCLQASDTIKLLIHHLESDIDFSRKSIYFADFVKTRIRLYMVMNVGGVVLGLLSSIPIYYLMKKVVTRLRSKAINTNKAII